MSDNKVIVLNYIDRVWNQHDDGAIEAKIVPNGAMTCLMK